MSRSLPLLIALITASLAPACTQTDLRFGGRDDDEVPPGSLPSELFCSVIGVEGEEGPSRRTWYERATQREVQVDNDTDGDGRVDESLFYTYDDQGRRATQGYDGNADGRLDTVSTYSYDEEGALLGEEIDLGNNGAINQRWIYEYTPEGQLSLQRFDADNDGRDDRVTSWTYHENGEPQLQEVDVDGDGLVDERTGWEYPGPLLRLEYFDFEADDTFDEIRSYFSNAAGRLVRIEWDDQRDGELNATWWYAYNDDNNLEVSLFDHDGDNEVDERWEHFYALDRRLTREERDNNFDGVVDFTLSWWTDCPASFGLLTEVTP